MIAQCKESWNLLNDIVGAGRIVELGPVPGQLPPVALVVIEQPE